MKFQIGPFNNIKEIFLTQLKKNRKLNGLQIQNYHKHPYWCEIGYLVGGIKVLVVKNCKKYYFY